MRITSTRIFAEIDRKKCAACGADRGITSFDYDWAKAGKDQALMGFLAQIEHVRKLKFGSLHRCVKCDDWWFLNENSPAIERIPIDRRSIVEAWDGLCIDLTTDMIDAFRTIGAAEADLYGNGQDELKIPCQISWHDGTVDDPCLVLITKRPPIDSWMKKFRLFKNVAIIEPSEFALPAEVRKQTRRAPEARMGFSPTLIESIHGDRMILNWTVDILNHGRIKGRDVRLSAQGFTYHQDIPILGNPVDEISYVYCDWFNDCRNTKIPGT